MTLLEVLIALAMTTVTLWAISTIYIMQVRTQAVEEDVMEMQQSVRATMDLIVRELKMAGYDPRGVNHDTNPLNDFVGVSCHPSQLLVRSDLSGNGMLTESNESILYVYDATMHTIRRSTGGGKQPVAENIDDFIFVYLDGGGQPTVESADIRQVELAVTARMVRPDSRYPTNQGYRTFALRSRVTPRNLD